MPATIALLAASSVMAQPEVQITHRREGLPNVMARLKAGEPVVVAYFGGSITAGAGASNPGKTSYTALTTAWLKAQYPKTPITEVNAAIGGTGSEFGAYRLGREVLSHRPNLLFVEYAVNDSSQKDETTKVAMEAIVRKTWAADPEIDICFVYTLMDGMLPDLKAGRLYNTMQLHEAIAEHYGIPSINVAAVAAARINSGEMPWAEFSHDNTHPTDAGFAMYAETIESFLSDEAARESQAAGRRGVPRLYEDSLEGAKMIPLELNASASGWEMDEKAPAGLPKMVASETPGAQITFPFTGDRVGITYALGMDTGDIDYSIDGGEFTRIRVFNQFAALFFHLSYRMLATGLSDGSHTLTIRISAEKDERSKGTRTRIRYLLVNEPAAGGR